MHLDEYVVLPWVPDPSSQSRRQCGQQTCGRPIVANTWSGHTNLQSDRRQLGDLEAACKSVGESCNTILYNCSVDCDNNGCRLEICSCKM